MMGIMYSYVNIMRQLLGYYNLIGSMHMPKIPKLGYKLHSSSSNATLHTHLYHAHFTPAYICVLNGFLLLLLFLVTNMRSHLKHPTSAGVK